MFGDLKGRAEYCFSCLSVKLQCLVANALLSKISTLFINRLNVCNRYYRHYLFFAKLVFIRDSFILKEHRIHKMNHLNVRCMDYSLSVHFMCLLSD